MVTVLVYQHKFAARVTVCRVVANAATLLGLRLHRPSCLRLESSVGGKRHGARHQQAVFGCALLYHLSPGRIS